MTTDTFPHQSVVPHKSFGVQTEDYFGNKVSYLS